MTDLDTRREAVAQARARLDHHLDELAQQVPDRDQLVAVGTKFAAAAGGLLAGVGVVVIATKSRLAARRDSKQARAYAEAVVSAMPDVVAAWQARSEGGEVPARPADLPKPVARKAPEPVTDDERDTDDRARGGAPTAILMGLGVVGGVALSRYLGER